MMEPMIQRRIDEIVLRFFYVMFRFAVLCLRLRKAG